MLTVQDVENLCRLLKEADKKVTHARELCERVRMSHVSAGELFDTCREVMDASGLLSAAMEFVVRKAREELNELAHGATPNPTSA